MLLAATVKPLAVNAKAMLLAADCALAAMVAVEVAGTVMVTLVVAASACSLRRLAAAVMLTQLAGDTPRMVAMLLASVEALVATAAACRGGTGR